MNTELIELIKGLELELLQPDIRKSADRLNELLADDFTEIGQSGKHYTKDDIVAMLPQQAEASYSVHDFQAREISPAIILITYRAEVLRAQHSQPNLSMRSSLWQKRVRGWQLVFHQGTPIHA